MSKVVNSEDSAINAGRSIVQGLTIAAGAVVAISGACAGVGFSFISAYLSSIGAPWFREAIPVTSLIQLGAPFVLVFATSTMLALLIHGISGRLPKPRFILGLWVLWTAIGVIVLLFLDWPLGCFFVYTGAGVGVGMLAPGYLIWLANSWAGRRIGVLAILINVIALATVAPAIIGVMKSSVDRFRPEYLAEVSLRVPDGGNWRLVITSGEQILLTRGDRGQAFHVYKVITFDQVEVLKSTRSSTPWAP